MTEFNTAKERIDTNTPLISVIVPIYGVEQYLHKCVDSILAQTYRNIEIILVEDGSPDHCSELCDELATKDNRVKVCHKQNGGLSDARNAGLRLASGSFISFVDSDDYISPIFLEVLYSVMEATDANIVALPGGHDFHDAKEVELQERISTEAIASTTSLLLAHSYIKKMLYQRMATGAPWRLYRRQVLGMDPFPVGLYYEDTATAHIFAHRAQRIAIVDNRELYAYRLRDTSIVRQQFKPIKAQSSLMVTRQLFEDIARWYPDLKSAAASRCFSINRMVFAQIPAADSKMRDSVWLELIKYRPYVLKDSEARRRERLAASVSLFGKPAFSAFCAASRKFGLMV